MEFRILGPVELTADGRALALGGVKQKALLALLLMHANEVVPRERLVDELWSGADPRDGGKALSVAVSRLRKTFALGHFDGDGCALLTRSPGYELRLSGERLDLHRFERLAKEARAADDPATAASRMREALDLWRGPPLADLAYEPFCQAEIVRLEEVRLAALEDRLGAELELGASDEAAAELEVLVGEHPLRERLRALQMLALYRAGRQGDALAAYQAAREALTDGLGIEPGRELRELQAAILRQDAGLERRPSPAPKKPTELEREEERAALAASLADARAGRGALTLVEGPAGIGKTRMLEVAREEAAATGMTVIAARGAELERDFSFGVVRQLFERTVARRRTELLGAGAAGLAAPVLDQLSGDAEGARPTHAVLHGLYWLTVALAEAAPLLIVVDDLQWADDPSLRFLLHLAPRLDGLPVALLVGRRDGEAADLGLVDELALETRKAPIRPAPLAVEAVAELLADGFDEAPGEALADACAEVTGGNPYLLHELIAGLRSQGAALHDLPIAEVRRLGPERIAKALLLRIGRLHPAAPRLVEALAVLGDTAPDPVIARLAGLDEAQARELRRGLSDAFVLTDPPALEFVHPIVRAAIYEDLPLNRRVASHVRAATLLLEAKAPDDEVAAHILASDPGLVDGAATTLRAAATTAMRRGAPDSAARLLGRAMAEPVDDAERAQILAALGEAEHELGIESAHERYLAAIELTDDPLDRARLINTLAWTTGPVPELQLRQLPLYERASVDAAADTELAAMLWAARLFVLEFHPERVAEAEAEAGKFAELEGRTPAERLLLALAALWAMNGDGAEAAKVSSLARRAAVEPVMFHSSPQPIWMIHVGHTLNATQNWDLGERLFTEILAESERGGSPFGFAAASYFRSIIRHTRGDLRLAEEDAQAPLGAIDDAHVGIWNLRPIIEVLADTGRASEGEELLARYGYAGEIEPIRPLTPLLIARGRMRVNAGDLEAGRSDLETALERLASGRSRGPVGLDAKLALALVLHRSGDPARARALSDEALAAARAWGTSRLLGGSLRVAALLRGDPGERLRLLREAAAIFEGSATLLWRAEALVDLGTELTANGDPGAAIATLTQALDLAERAGADPLAKSAATALKSAGGEPRRRDPDGAATLTAMERRITRMAAAGRTDKEIAQALFATMQTVETHLRRAYAKLGITSRKEVPRI